MSLYTTLSLLKHAGGSATHTTLEVLYSLSLFFTYFDGVVVAWGELLGWEGDEGRVSMEFLRSAVKRMWVSNFVTLLFPVL